MLRNSSACNKNYICYPSIR